MRYKSTGYVLARLDEAALLGIVNRKQQWGSSRCTRKINFELTLRIMAGSKALLSRLAHRTKLVSRLTRVGHIAWSGLFDKTHYRRNYPGLGAFWSKFPIAHYVLIGERMGYAPFSQFDPVSYADLYSDVATYPHGPLMHYIRHGKSERRITQSPLDAGVYFEGTFPSVRPWPKTAQFALVVHVFYLDVWEKFAAHLSEVNLDLDVIVTVPDAPEFDPVAEAIAAGDVPVSHIQRQPNVGRDVLAFLNLVNSGMLSRYDAVCKLHTKKSPHLLDGDVWREELTDGLLPSRGVRGMIEGFLADRSAKKLDPDPYLYTDNKSCAINKPVAERLADQVGLSLSTGELQFAAGSMFWMKPELINVIRDLGFQANQFVLERGQLDGTTAHAFERLTGVLCARAGGHIAVVSDMMDAEDTQKPERPSQFKMITDPTQ